MYSKLLEKERHRIGKKVRVLREQRGLTQAELSARLAMSQARLSLIEHGKASLTAEQFLELLRLLRVSISTFSEPTSAASELQATLARLGAFHLQEDSDV